MKKTCSLLTSLLVLGVSSATLTGEASGNEVVMQGRFAGALDASKAPAISTKELPEYGTVPFSVEFWCKLDSTDEYNGLVSNQPKESSRHWEIYTAPGGMLAAYLPGLTPEHIHTQTSLGDGKWHYVAMVVSGSDTALFVDGSEAARRPVSAKPTGTVVPGPLNAGRVMSSGGKNFYCDGRIDELRISRGTRKVSSIPDAPFTADAQTVGLWHFDRAEGSMASPESSIFPDSSTHAISLTQTPGVSLSVADRVGFKAGPSPLDSPAQMIALRQGSLRLPEEASRYSLDGDWQLVEGGWPEDRLEGDWPGEIKAQVPGSVHTALFQAGVIPYPYEGKNQNIVKGWSNKTYYYKKMFPRPPKGQDETLVFEGICNRCEVWLNKRKLGEHEGMFDPVEYPVKDLLEDENMLIVKLEPALDWRKSVVFSNSYGWHYSKFPPLGIWRPVSVRGEPEVRMQSPFVATINAGDGEVDLVTSLVSNGGTPEGKLVGVIAPDNFAGTTYHFEREIAAGAKDIHLRFKIPNPHLWWPVDMGKPNLYRLSVAFLPKGGGRADVKDIRFGIRTVEMAPVNGKPRPDRADWTFVVNGRPMFVKGAGWCTMDAMMDFSRARYERFLDLARDQHIQMLRAWGPGLVETDDFYDLCDRNGIMVMQEWPTSWNSHLTQPFDMLEKTVRTGILRLRNHPSLVIYGAGNESKDPYGPAIDMMGRLSIELDGTRDFHRGEPYGGSRHYYQVYWHAKHMDNAFTAKAIFYGEFGIASYPCLESVRRFLPKGEQNLWPPPEDGSFGYHTPMFNKLSTMGDVSSRRDLDRVRPLVEYFTAGETMEKFIIGSQLAQAVGVRHTLERMRTRWPESTGALYYKMNDNCPAASWATVDWYGAPKIAHYLIQDSFSPLLAVVLFDKASSYGEALSAPVFLLDDASGLDGKNWEVLIRAFGGDLKLIKETRFNGTGAIDRVKLLGNFTLDGAQTKTTPLLVVTDVKLQSGSLQRNYYIANFEPAKDCLFNLPKTSVSMQLGDGEVTVKNTGNLPAVGVNIARPGHLDTFTVEDNYFWLDVGETRTLKVSDTKGLAVGAWNTETSQGPPL